MRYEDRHGNLTEDDEEDDESWDVEDGDSQGFEELKGMMFEDRFGNLMAADEVDELSSWEVEERNLHVSELRL